MFIIGGFLTCFSVFNSPNEFGEGVYDIIVKYRKLMFVGIAFFLIAIIIPSKQTIMYIAASEYGQEVMKNPKVGEIANDSFNLLHTWIKSQTKELNK